MNRFNLNDLRFTNPKSGDNIFKYSSKEQDDYMHLYNAYRTLFSKYIMSKLNIKKYDAELDNSEVKFYNCDNNKMDIYQFFTSDELKYFYIRNNCYVERLDDSEKDLLRARISNNNYELDDEAITFINNTYKKIVFEFVDDSDNNYIFYGPENRRFLVKDGTIVIGINYDEFYEDGLSDDEWYNNHLKQLQNLTKLLNEMITSYKTLPDLHVVVLKYDEYSIIRRRG